ncbi:hypothetical protein L873DRAFT_1236118 [Choiromyces venosus 120613-1]|uniref:Uncharacterized protein n=1 Tax=Choiromyces venosus 120613-1 TaxID=1336337 RepID=A0A3N4JIS8_9PEZI|nr:hypothetical protein L873DRAFT_1236118 [Choiromyces venosus 120613-1]
MERGHESRGPVITADTNKVGARLRAHQHDLFASFHNISYLKRFLLGAIDKAQRDKMQEAIQGLPASCKELWCKSSAECFALRACLVNVFTEPHVDCGDVEWAMISPFGNFNDGEFCIADLGRRFAFHEGHIAGIRGRRLAHPTRKWAGSRICLVSTMHRALIPQCTKRRNSGESVSAKGSGSREGELARKRAKRKSQSEAGMETSFRYKELGGWTIDAILRTHSSAAGGMGQKPWAWILDSGASSVGCLRTRYHMARRVVLRDVSCWEWRSNGRLNGRLDSLSEESEPEEIEPLCIRNGVTLIQV